MSTAAHVARTPRGLIAILALITGLMATIVIATQEDPPAADAANVSFGADVFVGHPTRIYNSMRNPGYGYVKVVDVSEPGLQGNCYPGAFVNITVAESTGNGYLTAWGPGSAIPGSSNVNYGPAAPSNTVSNAAFVELYSISNGDKYFKFYLTQRARVIVDLQGFALTC